MCQTNAQQHCSRAQAAPERALLIEIAVDSQASITMDLKEEERPKNFWLKLLFLFQE